MDEELIHAIGTKLEAQGLSNEMIDEYFEHHGVKGMKWGIRKEAVSGSSGNKGDVHGLRLHVTGGSGPDTQTRSQRNWKRASAFLGGALLLPGVGGFPALMAYNIVSKPLAPSEQKKFGQQSRKARVGKTVAAGLLTSPIGALAYYQMSARVPKKKKK